MVRSDDPDYRRRLRRKNIAVALLLLALVALFYLITLVRMGQPA
jgi:hypothetical protein